MLYVQESLGPNEELIHVGKYNVMYTVHAAFLIVLSMAGSLIVIAAANFIYKQIGWFPQNLGIADSIPYLHPGVRIGAFALFCVGLMGFAQMMIAKMTTEIAITNNRLIYKRGLVARHIGEIGVDRIEGVTVLQTIMGRIFNYGRLSVRGMGIGEVILPAIENPIGFRQAIERAKASMGS